MLRKCKVGNLHRPAYFHGWFQFGNSEDGMDGMAVVEYEDGTTGYFCPGYITFDTPPTAEQVEGASLQHITPPGCVICGCNISLNGYCAGCQTRVD